MPRTLPKEENVGLDYPLASNAIPSPSQITIYGLIYKVGFRIFRVLVIPMISNENHLLCSNGGQSPRKIMLFWITPLPPMQPLLPHKFPHKTIPECMCTCLLNFM